MGCDGVIENTAGMAKTLIMCRRLCYEQPVKPKTIYQRSTFEDIETRTCPEPLWTRTDYTLEISKTVNWQSTRFSLIFCKLWSLCSLFRLGAYETFDFLNWCLCNKMLGAFEMFCLVLFLSPLVLMKYVLVLMQITDFIW